MPYVSEIQDKVIDKLLWVYYNEEHWHKNKLPEESARRYFKKLLEQGNILCHIQDGELIGYVEFWRINYDQFGRIICHNSFSATSEDIVSGDIAYVANTWINPAYRSTEVYKMLKMEFFSVNYKCKYFVGEALRKKHQPVKVFDRTKFFKEGVS